MKRFTGAFLCLAGPLLIAQFTANSSLVEVYAAVRDGKGNYVDGLGKERFQILDGDQPQSIVSFESNSEDLSCAILLDTTGSMRDALGATKNAVSMLLDQMRGGDTVALFGFNTSVTTLQEFTADKSVAKRAVLRLRAEGQTALYDAVAQVAQEISSRGGKRAIVLFTDGADNASAISADAAIRRALRTGVPIFAIAEGDATRNGKLLNQLKSLSAGTGGLSYEARSPNDVLRAFADIQNALKHLYVMSYTAPFSDQAKWHPIRVIVSGVPEVTVRTREGYYPE